MKRNRRTCLFSREDRPKLVARLILGQGKKKKKRSERIRRGEEGDGEQLTQSRSGEVPFLQENVFSK
ncbi:hypothetical protein POVWA2_092840 [Plasmodium ovale wallikeri]|uniref:Uncharacterized protein n=1 Tax=Plasmodium ovale wallikeri TaxID=864142 RepID=A0A1A9ASS8_PLAOA|nr:hypothetical protein POVWA2_092840 [Plasmodium ovale wallikeri]